MEVLVRVNRELIPLGAEGNRHCTFLVLHILLPHALDDSPVFLGEIEFSVELKCFYSNYESYPK